MTTWAGLPIEMRAAVLERVESARDFAACMASSRLFYEAASDTERRMWRYAPDRTGAPNVFDSDEPVAVVAAVWRRWARRLDLDYEHIVDGPAQNGRLDVVRLAWAIAGLADGAPAPVRCLCPQWRMCACDSPKDAQAMRHKAAGEALCVAAGAGHLDVVFYMISASAALVDARSHALCAAARHAPIDVIEALLGAWAADDETIARMVDHALDFDRPEVVIWLHDSGWLTAEAAAPFLARLVLVAAACARASDFESAWRLLAARDPDLGRCWWRATMLRAGHTGNVDALAWLLDSPPDPGMPPSSPSANNASYALIGAIEHGHRDAALLLRDRGVSVSVTGLACALRQAKANGHGDAVVPLCEAFCTAASAEAGYRLAECACAMDHADLLAFACDRFGPHLAPHARRSARAYGSGKCSAVLLWLDQHFPA